MRPGSPNPQPLSIHEKNTQQNPAEGQSTKDLKTVKATKTRKVQKKLRRKDN